MYTHEMDTASSKPNIPEMVILEHFSAETVCVAFPVCFLYLEVSYTIQIAFK